jgi:hypothetical protein
MDSNLEANLAAEIDHLMETHSVVSLEFHLEFHLLLIDYQMDLNLPLPLAIEMD